MAKLENINKGDKVKIKGDSKLYEVWQLNGIKCIDYYGETRLEKIIDLVTRVQKK